MESASAQKRRKVSFILKQQVYWIIFAVQWNVTHSELMWIYLRGLCLWPYLNFETVYPPAFFLNSFLANVELVSEAGNYKFCLSRLTERDCVSTKAVWYSFDMLFRYLHPTFTCLPFLLLYFLLTFLSLFFPSFLPTSDAFILKQSTKLNLYHSGSRV